MAGKKLNIEQRAIDILRIISEEKGGFTLVYSKRWRRWVIKSGVVKVENIDFVEAVRQFCLKVYPKADSK